MTNESPRVENPWYLLFQDSKERNPAPLTRTGRRPFIHAFIGMVFWVQDKLPRIIAYIALFAGFTSFLSASTGTISELFSEANGYYDNQQYAQAIAAYEAIFSGYNTNDAGIYYNLGNSYYRTNRIGKAILNYERALRVDPRNEDIKFNLSYVKSLVNDSVEKNAILAVFNLLTVKELTMATMIFCWALCIGLVLIILGKIPEKPGGIINLSLIGIFIFLLVWSVLKIRYESRPAGVVITVPCEARNGPGNEYTVGFSLAEGKKVIILGEENSWYAIGLPNEKLKGWIEKVVVEKI